MTSTRFMSPSEQATTNSIAVAMANKRIFIDGSLSL
jgi:hypothetical protein